MNPILFWYLVLSGVVMVIMAISLAWEDYDMRYIHTYRQNTSKFGYNYSVGGLWWLFLGACLPFVNLLVILFFTTIKFAQLFERR